MQEKSALFGRRSGGGRPIRLDRGPIQRRKTQPITFDDIARVNQSILESGGAGLLGKYFPKKSNDTAFLG